MYTFKTTERTNDKATEFETKSLLYLMTKVKGHDKIDVFIIDCFNDVSGANPKITEVWDVQSKGVSSLTPRKIGASLYTLYDNFASKLTFHHYILFMPVLRTGYLCDENLEIFDFSNFLTTKQSEVAEGLQVEAIRRYNTEHPDSKIECLSVDEIAKVSEFLLKALFVTDRYQKFEYVKDVIIFKDSDLKSDEFFTHIFDEIRVIQSGKKIKNIAGKSVASIREAIAFEKNIHRKDIEMLIINRIIGYDIFTSLGIPLNFIRKIKGIEIEDVKDIVQNCRTQITKTLFNKNNKNAFWLLLENIIIQVSNEPKASIEDINAKIPSIIRNKVFTLDDTSLLFLIAMIKDGLDNESN